MSKEDLDEILEGLSPKAHRAYWLLDDGHSRYLAL
jgi:hypothetical protein